MKAANYPLIPEDFSAATALDARSRTGRSVRAHDRAGAAARIRNERRPDSKYAAIENCRYEVREGETMMKREGIAWLSSTHKSIEEIATTILRDLRPDRLAY